MRSVPTSSMALLVCSLLSLNLSSCASMDDMQQGNLPNNAEPPSAAMNVSPNYESRIPPRIATGEKTIVVDPRVHVWGAYGADGGLQRAGLATAGGDWCPDIGRPCHTRIGYFRINSLGSPECKSSKYPLPRGGAPMPYCMFFNGNQGLHGSYEVVEDNVSHGCVRLQVADAEWLRYNFANVGTRVIVRPYY